MPRMEMASRRDKVTELTERPEDVAGDDVLQDNTCIEEGGAEVRIRSYALLWRRSVDGSQTLAGSRLRAHTRHVAVLCRADPTAACPPERPRLNPRHIED